MWDLFKKGHEMGGAQYSSYRNKKGTIRLFRPSSFVRPSLSMPPLLHAKKERSRENEKEERKVFLSSFAMLPPFSLHPA